MSQAEVDALTAIYGTKGARYLEGLSYTAELNVRDAVRVLVQDALHRAKTTH